MLARTVHAAIRFLVQKHVEVMLTGNTFHQVHDKLVVVVCQITVFEDRSQFELVGCYLVMTCLGGNTQFVAFDFEFFHKCSDAWRDRAEIVVFQLLIFSGRMSHKCPSCQAEVGTCII